MSIIDKPIVEHDLVRSGEDQFVLASPRPRGHRRKRQTDRLQTLRAVVLLDGAVRRADFATALDRSLLELPIARDRILLDLWRDQITTLLSGLNLETATRIIVGRTSRLPVLRDADRAAGMSAEFDPSELRGTGGVLHDLAAEYDDDDLLLVANAAQLLVESLSAIAIEAADRGGDVTVVANADGVPASVSLIRCGALRDLPAVGFIDLKEQGLPLMAARNDVRVHSRSRAAGLPIRTPRDYLTALHAYHVLQGGDAAAASHDQPFAERWRRRFSIIESGAVVADDAELHNSVVLRGGRVESHALLVNSIVCGSGGVVHKREQVIERLVSGTGRKPLGQEQHHGR